MGNILTRELLLRSVAEWNAARESNPYIIPDLRKANLVDADLEGANLEKANLVNADINDTYLIKANLSGADLSYADLRWTTLFGAKLNDAKLAGADISQARLNGADFTKSNLINANLTTSTLSRTNFSGANLRGVDLSGANLSETILNDATVGYTAFGAVDLSNVIGLETVKHDGPSTIGIDTIYKSKGNIPEVFLRGCGVPDIFIEYVRSLTAQAFDYYSCFISHSTADKVFVDRLHADLQAKGVRCWYAPHDMEGGEHVETQIDRAIKIHEKLLLVLSESSINSNWVKREITKAFKREEAEGKRVLFPISLVDFSKIEAWEFVDSKGRDLAEEIRKFYIPSFKGWENDNSLYTTEFDKLLKAFKDKSKQ
jgi:uncharacterized protein YjbI with pentapeptide repeats